MCYQIMSARLKNDGRNLNHFNRNAAQSAKLVEAKCIFTLILCSCKRTEGARNFNKLTGMILNSYKNAVKHVVSLSTSRFEARKAVVYMVRITPVQKYQ